MTESRKGVTVKARLNLKIDASLKEWARSYARRHGKDITALICEYLLYLQKVEQDAHSDVVEQI